MSAAYYIYTVLINTLLHSTLLTDVPLWGNLPCKTLLWLLSTFVGRGGGGGACSNFVCTKEGDIASTLSKTELVNMK